MEYKQIYIRYRDTGRPALGLTIIVGQSTGTKEVITDPNGYAGRFEVGAHISARRGEHIFGFNFFVPDSSSPTVELTIAEHEWPPHLLALRQALSDPETKAKFVEAAKRTLTALHQAGVLDQLTDWNHLWDTDTTTDNPHIVAGALLPSLAIARNFVLRRGEALARSDVRIGDSDLVELWRIKNAILAILQWIYTRQDINEGGYIIRWEQEHRVDSWIDARPGHDGHAWKAEPSLDEYSGLLMGLVFLQHLSRTGPSLSPFLAWTGLIERRVDRILTQVARYLEGTMGWLVRPVRGDLTVRGAGLIANTYPLYLILKGYGDWGFRNARPLRLHEYEKDVIDESESSLSLYRSTITSLRESGDTASADLVKQMADRYEEELSKFVTFRDASGSISILEWAGPIAALTMPLISVIAVGVVVSAAAHIVDKKIRDVTDLELWYLFGEALGPPAAVDAGGYNAHIFDRFSLAAFWARDATIVESFYKRAERTIGGDRPSWQVLGIAARTWFGSDFDSSNILNSLLFNVNGALGSEIEASLANVEAFILGWSLICLALDIDPEVPWSECLEIHRNYAHDQPSELQALQTMPRFAFVDVTVTIDEIRENKEEPYIWIIPTIYTYSEEGRIYRILDPFRWGFVPEHWHSYKVGDVMSVPWHFLKWPVDIPNAFLPTTSLHLILTIVGWEHDFTPIRSEWASRRHRMEVPQDILEHDQRWGLAQTRRWMRQLLEVLDPRDFDSVGAMGDQMKAQLEGKLANLYPMPEAPQGSRFSSDDFVGVSVVTLAADDRWAHVGQEIDVKLERSPKPKPRYTSYTVRGRLRFCSGLETRVIGSITADITRDANEAGESALGDVIADAQLAATAPAEKGGAQMAFAHPGGIRANLDFASSGNAPDGEVTYGEVLSVQPFMNTLVTMTLTGQQIKRLLEQQFSRSSPGYDPNPEPVQILQVSEGFAYTWSASRPAGQKIHPADISINGVPIDLAASYRVTVNSFLANGGDYFSVFAEGTDRTDFRFVMYELEVLERYFIVGSPVSPGPQNRITMIS